MKPMLRFLGMAAAIATLFAVSPTAQAASAGQIRHDSERSLKKLLAANPIARSLAREAVAVLVFPSIVKGGFIVAGQYGEGALIEGGETTGYYSSLAASIGYQAGVEKYGYALFFMNDGALRYLKKSKGWSLGAGPSLVVVDAGFTGNFSTTTARKDIYAVVFNQEGLMAGVGVEGAKITRIHPD